MYPVPLIQVASSEGSVSKYERRLILEIAGGRGIEFGSTAYKCLTEWLNARPTEEFFERILRVISALIKLFTVAEPFSQYEVEPEAKMNRIRDIITLAEKKLIKAGLEVIPVVEEGEPKPIHIREAETWNADCIFLGAQGHRFLDRFLLGSVSAAVAARAHCSVEVVCKARNTKSNDSRINVSEH